MTNLGRAASPSLLYFCCETQEKAKFHYTSWFGASSELASVMEFGLNSSGDEIANVIF